MSEEKKPRFYLQGIIEDAHQTGDRTNVVVVSVHNPAAKYWSVYRVEADGTSTCIADCPTIKDGNYITKALNTIDDVSLMLGVTDVIASR